MASKLRVDSILPVDGAPTNGGGGIVQIQQTVYTGVKSQSGAIATPLTDFEDVITCSLTPKFSTSKILVEMNLVVSCGNNNNIIMARIRRKIASGSFSDLDDALGAAASSRYRCTSATLGRVNSYSVMPMSMKYLDSPSTTDACTYSFSLAHDSGSAINVYLNQGANDTSSYAYVPRSISTITLSEISA